MSKALNIVIAFVIAIALTTGFLYVKFNKYEKNVPVDDIQAETVIENKEVAKSEEVILQTLVAPQAEPKTEVEKANEQKVLESLTAKQDNIKTITLEQEEEIMKSLLAPVK